MIEKALTTALHMPMAVFGSGRTDSGVHSLGQTAHFSYTDPVDLRKLQHSLNGLLPPDIRIKSLSKATDDFHARFSARGKIYRYRLHKSPIASPFTRLYAYHLPYPIDLPLLQKAKEHFIGKHDFTSFSNEAHKGSAANNAVRTIKRIDLIEIGEEIHLEFEADGFLYKMVRNITGTLLDVARGKIPLEEIPKILSAKDRRKAGTCAPAHGLFLVEVIY